MNLCIEISENEFREFSSECPKSEGLYLFTCGENDDLPEYVAISKNKGILIAHSMDLGKYHLKSFHDGLTEPKWKKIA